MNERDYKELMSYPRLPEPPVGVTPELVSHLNDIYTRMIPIGYLRNTVSSDLTPVWSKGQQWILDQIEEIMDIERKRVEEEYQDRINRSSLYPPYMLHRSQY
jgi:hypothetical protein